MYRKRLSVYLLVAQAFDPRVEYEADAVQVATDSSRLLDGGMFLPALLWHRRLDRIH